MITDNFINELHLREDFIYTSIKYGVNRSHLRTRGVCLERVSMNASLVRSQARLSPGKAESHPNRLRRLFAVDS